MAKFRWQVDIIESERGWGQKIEDIKFFDVEGDADDFVEEYNKENNLSHVPDWYMYAAAPVKVQVD